MYLVLRLNFGRHWSWSWVKILKPNLYQDWFIVVFLACSLPVICDIHLSWTRWKVSLSLSSGSFYFVSVFVCLIVCFVLRLLYFWPAHCSCVTPISVEHGGRCRYLLVLAPTISPSSGSHYLTQQLLLMCEALFLLQHALCICSSYLEQLWNKQIYSSFSSLTAIGSTKP